jgi:serine/threonine protein kinase
VTTSPHETNELAPGVVLTAHQFPSPAAPGAPLPPAKTTRYEIIKCISERDSYGYTYTAKKLSATKRAGARDQVVLIKTPKITSHMPPHQAGDVLQEIALSFENQVKIADRIEDLNRVTRQTDPKTAPIAAEIIESYYLMAGDQGVGELSEATRDRQYRVPFLVQQYLPYPNMLTYFNSPSLPKGVRSHTPFSGIADPSVWFALAEKIVHIVRRVHNRQIVHGELTPKNFLIREQNNELFPILVGFGNSFQLDLSSVTGSHGTRADTYVAPERRYPNVSWSTPADIYSLGGILYYLSTGAAPPDIDKSGIFTQPDSWIAGLPDGTIDAWKALIHSSIAKSNRDLIKRNEGIVKIVDKCLRTQPEDRFGSPELVAHALGAMNFRRGKADVSARIRELTKEWEDVEADPSKVDDLFHKVLNDRLDLLLREVAGMKRRHFEIYGEREQLIDTLIKYMGSLQSGDIYATITVPDYWTEQNLGINGRFLTINKDLVRNGVVVNRLFLVPSNWESDATTVKILRAHLRAWDDLDETQQEGSPRFDATGAVGNADGGSMYVGVLEFGDQHMLNAFLRQVRNVAIWSRSSGETMSITFEAQPIYAMVKQGDKGPGVLVQRGSKIVKVRFRQLEKPGEYVQMSEFFRREQHVPLPNLRTRLDDAEARLRGGAEAVAVQDDRMIVVEGVGA